MADFAVQLRQVLATREPPVPPVEIPDDVPDRDLVPTSELRPAAVLVPLIDRPDGWQVLLTQRTEHLPHHAGQISFPGGRLEMTDSTPVSGALRETEEEIGVEAARVKIIGSLSVLPTITGFVVVPVVGMVDPDYRLQLDRSEVDSAFEVPLDFLVDRGNHVTEWATYRGRRRSYTVIQYQQRRIWGATAQMIVDLTNRLHPLS